MMKRTYWLEMAVMVLVTFCVGTAMADEEKCTEGNFAVSELPVNIESYPEPCSRIIMPADSLVWMKVMRQPIAVKFGENKVIVKERMFRVGSKHEEFILRPTEKYEFYLRPEYHMKISDVPKHLKGGESALWYEVMSTSAQGERVEFLSEYPTQVLVPRGCNVKIMANAAFKVRYAGEERECAAEEVVALEGKLGADLVEIYGMDRDGEAVVGVSLRKVLSLEQGKAAQAAKKKTTK
ncbi:MAG: hypothetical protein UY31_C0041G0008 [Candidatus Wolfebacteria bacterium GW2011_GWE1_48_7]|uniref:Uncharacterized protein n=2 Tax=Candidatus Wolfeibacteriota TaxID=1752735 RepID=A0A0G4AR00_9BACT|nr:MAG: hypothetical protein UX70_C0001G0226 [Candidatus Wolfebacteria bacterium GW2011_GWB1_47_1]KKU42027.1 MAG: hypothetical protein UX58_C0004G0086 [Candidatus Wolfebacteria bacterium GW2011_GWB2_46_69]KKU54436.1 MAG: hypothetical protein UX76_C0002G0029 [Candidatus Wolfebacteria bacterium GW2011_GWC1_47_103]KKU59764.1 MAG: hypothetical protein UX83_C0002G0051 [Candidatus Wolfebacteria bacterium GW2011_GWE2_47_12]KKU65755.1 MAG: hypothetical protein UX90_C0002G0131 [Candidatus Wolfebacteria 